MTEEIKKPTVLIFEDEMQMRFYLQTLVKSIGFEPVIAKDGIEGLEMLKNIRPSVIILDIMMPNMGGGQVYKELVTQPELKNIPVIFFSGVDRAAFFHYIRMLNANLPYPVPDPLFYVAKDADPQYLKTVIKKCVKIF
jgi:two-component system, OmpR family, phosphate regulon response regulator PhoB